MQTQNSTIAALVAPLRARLGRVFLPCAALLLAFAASGSSMAQSAAQAPAAIKSSEAAKASNAAVSVKLTQRKVIKGADGKEQLVDATTVKPGDVLEYRVTYVNNSAKAVTGLIGELPIPQGLEYQRKSAKPGNLQFKAATKEGVFAAEPLMRKVGSVQQEVPYSEYRKLNWTLGQLLAGSEVSVSARAQVQTYVAPFAAELQTSQAPPVSVVRVPAPAKP